MNEQELKEKLAYIFGWNVSQVEKTEFVKMIEKLVKIIEEYEKNDPSF